MSREPLDTLECLRKRGSFSDPVDIVQLWKTLVNKGSYEDTPYVKATFLAFGLYDTWRVLDATAHAMLDVLHAELQGLLSGKNRQRYSQAQGKLKDPIFMENVRDFVASMGPPTYHPDYMIHHGVGFFTGEHEHNDGIQPNFDVDVAWSGVLRVLFSPAQSVTDCVNTSSNPTRAV